MTLISHHISRGLYLGTRLQQRASHQTRSNFDGFPTEHTGLYIEAKALPSCGWSIIYEQKCVGVQAWA